MCCYIIATLEHFDVRINCMPSGGGIGNAIIYVLINQFTAVAMQNHEAIKGVRYCQHTEYYGMLSGTATN
jgi:hypothetical protein